MARHKSALEALRAMEKAYEADRQAFLRKAGEEISATVHRMVRDLASIAKDFPKVVSSAVAALVLPSSTPAARQMATERAPERLGLAAPEAAPGTATKSVAPKRRKRGKFRQTAEEMILALLKGQKALLTSQLSAEWKKSGRGGRVDQTLSRMMQAGKLKRRPLGGKKGSVYSVR